MGARLRALALTLAGAVAEAVVAVVLLAAAAADWLGWVAWSVAAANLKGWKFRTLKP